MDDWHLTMNNDEMLQIMPLLSKKHALDPEMAEILTAMKGMV